MKKKIETNINLPCKVLTCTDPMDVRYCQIYLISPTGVVLDSDGPWPNNIAKRKHCEMVQKHTREPSK